MLHGGSGLQNYLLQVQGHRSAQHRASRDAPEQLAVAHGSRGERVQQHIARAQRLQQRRRRRALADAQARAQPQCAQPGRQRRWRCQRSDSRLQRGKQHWAGGLCDRVDAAQGDADLQAIGCVRTTLERDDLGSAQPERCEGVQEIVQQHAGDRRTQGVVGFVQQRRQAAACGDPQLQAAAIELQLQARRFRRPDATTLRGEATPLHGTRIAQHPAKLRACGGYVGQRLRQVACR